MLFCAAQAPELFGRDQRYGVLPLYFSRVLTRVDYTLARAGGLFLAIFVISIVAAADPDGRRDPGGPGPADRAARRPSRDPALSRGLPAGIGPAGRGRDGHRRLDAAAGLRHGRDHRGVHHPADRRRADGRAGRRRPRPGPRAGQPGRHHRRGERGRLRCGLAAIRRSSRRTCRAGRTSSRPSWGRSRASCSSCGAISGSRRERTRPEPPAPDAAGPDAAPDAAARRPRSRSTTSHAGTATSWPSTTSRSPSVPA